MLPFFHFVLLSSFSCLSGVPLTLPIADPLILLTAGAAHQRAHAPSCDSQHSSPIMGSSVPP